MHTLSDSAASSHPQKAMNRAVVLLSGGLDSATCLAIARTQGVECHCVAFDYAQRHRHELAAAERVAVALGARSHRTLRIDLGAVGGSALTADIGVPKDRSHAEMSGSIPITYVPARNIIFMAMAAAVAEVVEAESIFIGVNAIDYSGYPDCRPEFITAFERALQLGTRAGAEGAGIRIEAPLVQMTKAQIIQTGVRLGVDYSLTHSCYDPVERDGRVLACGGCDSCALRREGFRAAGVTDPTPYA